MGFEKLGSSVMMRSGHVSVRLFTSDSVDQTFSGLSAKWQEEDKTAINGINFLLQEPFHRHCLENVFTVSIQDTAGMNFINSFKKMCK